MRAIWGLNENLRLAWTKTELNTLFLAVPHPSSQLSRETLHLHCMDYGPLAFENINRENEASAPLHRDTQQCSEQRIARMILVGIMDDTHNCQSKCHIES